ncbi:MAG: GNAT family N-acetyltransferase [Lachnospiraceae bacterium]
MRDFNEIWTERLYLRKLEMRDKYLFFNYRSMPDVYKFQSWKPDNIGEIEGIIYNNSMLYPNTINTWLQIAICQHDGTMIGDIGIHFVDYHQIELGYSLSPFSHGQGYASEAVRALINYAFSVWNKHRITASVDPENHRSIRLLRGLGFRQEAHFKKSLLLNENWCDDCVFAVLREEWNY